MAHHQPERSMAWINRAEGLALLAILILAALLRLVHVAENPGWYTDEITHLDIARHLLHGRVQYMAVQGSWLIFARLPLFELLLAGVFRLMGPGILPLRVLTGSLGVVSVGLVYAVVRFGTRRRGTALLAALALAVYPQAIIYSRIGFSYNLLAVLVLLAALALVRYDRADRARRWLILAGLCAGLGLISDVMMIAFVPPLLLVVAGRDWRDALRLGVLMALPPAVYSGVMLLTGPEAFLFDLRFTLARLGSPPATWLPTLAGNLEQLAATGWFAAGIVGLVMLRPGFVRWLALLCLVGPVLFLGRTVALYSLSAYYLIPLLPWVALGVGGLLDRLLVALQAGVRYLVLRGWPGWSVPAGQIVGIALLVGGPGVSLIRADWQGVQHGFTTPIDTFLVAPVEAQQVAACLTPQLDPDAVVIASPGVGWLLPARVADFQMMTAAAGETGPHLPGDLPPARWAFAPTLEAASYAVVDDLWRRWGAVHVPGVPAALTTIEAEWPLICTAGRIAAYANPARTAAAP